MNSKRKNKLRQPIVFGGISQKAILLFTKNLAIMLKSGSTLSEALAVLQKQATAKLKILLTGIIEKTNKGVEFSLALSKYPKTFSEIYINIIKIGEQSGTLEKNLEYLADQLDKSYKLHKKIVSAMLYPAIVITGILFLGIGIAVFILPKISRLFKSFRVELPWSTKALIAVSDFIQNHGLLTLIVAVMIIVLFIFLSRQKFVKPFTHKLFLMIPLIKQISRNSNLSMFYRSLSILLNSGVTIDEGMRICTKTINNVHYQKHLEIVNSKIKSGGSLFDALTDHPKLFPATDVQIITVGEESGSMANALAYSASIHDDELDDITQNLTTLLEPILFIFLGLMVALLALSIITPIYSITGQFNR